ncbi:excisionase family DNA-binding protein [Desulfotalea psychrophila]|uniref:excisionase family DNA-binding protein n=1 Tax=Desulfotalea psychrophila TaxID=84980 RepID=UPI00059B6E75|nr:excisionase family DNA-binding protein [Desulfotalea psychrophila]
MGEREYKELKAELSEIRGLLMQITNNDRMISIDEAAVYMGCSIATLRRRVQSKQLRNYAPPRKSYRFKVSELATAKSGGRISALSIL